MISFANINKQYGKQLLFVDASFQLNPGEKVGLVGPNGAGKTTRTPVKSRDILHILSLDILYSGRRGTPGLALATDGIARPASQLAKLVAVFRPES